MSPGWMKVMNLSFMFYSYSFMIRERKRSREIHKTLDLEELKGKTTEHFKGGNRKILEQNAKTDYKEFRS